MSTHRTYTCNSTHRRVRMDYILKYAEQKIKAWHKPLFFLSFQLNYIVTALGAHQGFCGAHFWTLRMHQIALLPMRLVLFTNVNLRIDMNLEILALVYSIC